MTHEPDGDEVYISNRATRRIVVSDDLPVVRDEVRGRRLEDPPEDVVDSRKPRKKVSPKFLGALVGGVMKETKGRANPALVNQILKQQLGK